MISKDVLLNEDDCWDGPIENNDGVRGEIKENKVRNPTIEDHEEKTDLPSPPTTLHSHHDESSSSSSSHES